MLCCACAVVLITTSSSTYDYWLMQEHRVGRNWRKECERKTGRKQEGLWKKIWNLWSVDVLWNQQNSGWSVCELWVSLLLKREAEMTKSQRSVRNMQLMNWRPARLPTPPSPLQQMTALRQTTVTGNLHPHLASPPRLLHCHKTMDCGTGVRVCVCVDEWSMAKSAEGYLI